MAAPEKLLTHFLRAFWDDHCVFEEASPFRALWENPSGGTTLTNFPPTRNGKRTIVIIEWWHKVIANVTIMGRALKERSYGP
jgi:hypothetical protein